MDSLVKPICKFLNFLYHVFLVFACLVLLSIVIIVSAQVFVRQVMGGTVSVESGSGSDAYGLDGLYHLRCGCGEKPSYWD